MTASTPQPPSTPPAPADPEPALTGGVLARSVLDRGALVRLGSGWAGVAALALASPSPAALSAPLDRKSVV